MYKMSFTTGGLFFNESLPVAELYDTNHNWQHTRNQVLAENILQTRTVSSARRCIREICARLQFLTAPQLQLLLSGSRQEQQYLLWVAICKYYPFIREFTVEVVREKYLRMGLTLHPQEYEIFFKAKAEWHNELERLKKSTKVKLRQVLFKTMREAEILSQENMIIPALLTEQFTKVLAMDDLTLLAVFPVSDMDINSWFT